MKQCNQLTFFMWSHSGSWHATNCTHSTSIPALSAVKTALCLALLTCCLLKHDNTYFPGKHTTIFSLGNMSVFLCAFSHIAPYVPYFPAQISAGKIQPGNPTTKTQSVCVDVSIWQNERFDEPPLSEMSAARFLVTKKSVRKIFICKLLQY